MNEGDTPKKGSWWLTVPGVLTATAGIITAVTGLILALYQVGVFGDQVRQGLQSKPPYLEPAPNTAKSSQGSATKKAPSPPSAAEPTGPTDQRERLKNAEGIDLLSTENGGQLLLAPNDAWLVANDGKEGEYREVRVGEEAVFAFKNERAATFDSFSMLIPKSGRNPKQFELLAGDESPAGPFRTIGTFQPQDVRVIKTGGWQEFRFPPVTAKYLKIKLRSNYEDVVWIDIYEFRLFGQLK